MSIDPFTILTHPIIETKARPRLLVDLAKKLRLVPPHQAGHPAVTQSLVRGLKINKQNFNLNPTSTNDLNTTVVALSQVDTLKQAIALKRAGQIKHLLAGPNIIVRACEENGLIASPEVDACLVPSPWVAESYTEDCPTLKARIFSWPVGVDAHFWQPSKQQHGTRQALIYWKTEGEGFVRQVERLLTKKGWLAQIIKYGTYSSRSYRHALRNASFAVFISRSESQGIALAEAWSTDVPTLTWNPRELVVENYVYKNPSSCPYLTPFTGLPWKDLEELSQLVDALPDTLSSFTPRQWVLENMTDSIGASNLCRIITKVSHKSDLN